LKSEEELEGSGLEEGGGGGRRRGLVVVIVVVATRKVPCVTSLQY